MQKYQSIKLAKKITESFLQPYDSSKVTNQEFFTDKMRLRTISKTAKKHSRLSFIGERHVNSPRWEVVWGEWSPTLKPNVTEETKNNKTNREYNTENLNYNNVGFTLVISTLKQERDKMLYMVMSKHGLQRLLQRSGNKYESAHDLRDYLDTVLKKLILRCLCIWENSTSDEFAEGYEVVDDLFIPIAMERGINRKIEGSHVFTIKTVMPTSYNSVKKTIHNIEQPQPKENIFEYFHLLMK